MSNNVPGPITISGCFDGGRQLLCRSSPVPKGRGVSSPIIPPLSLPLPPLTEGTGGRGMRGGEQGARGSRARGLSCHPRRAAHRISSYAPLLHRKVFPFREICLRICIPCSEHRPSHPRGPYFGYCSVSGYCGQRLCLRRWSRW